jgi:hypothetical protein
MKKSLLTTLALAGFFAVNAQTTIFTENFESTTGTAVPAGWTNTTNATDGGFITGDPVGTYTASTGLSSDYFAVDALTGSTRSLGTNDDGCNCDKSNEMISSPVINCTGMTTVFCSFDCFYFQGSYNGIDETMKFRVSNDGGTTWTDFTLTGAATWNTQMFDISSVAANQSNVKIAFWYDDGGDWLYGAVVDNIVVYEPAQRDMEGLTIDMFSYTANNTATTIAGTLQNLGGATVTSMDLNYNVDGGAAVTENLTGLSIAPLTAYNFSHGTQWTPTATGTHTISVWASNINGGADAVTSNDTVTFVTYTCSQTAQRMVLYEGFTSSTCGPCAAANPGLLSLLQANNMNMPGGKVAVVKYQMNYPSPGNDPCYTTACNTRHTTVYGVGGIPQGEMDGGWAWSGHPAGLTQQDIDDEYAVPAPVSITATASYSGNVINVSGTVNSYANITGNNKLLIALVEDHISSTDGAHGVQSNGETDWYDVLRKFAAGTNGTNLGNMTDGGAYNFNVNTTFSGTAGTTGDKIFTNINQMTAVLFVQDLTTKKVYQASVSDVVLKVEDPASTLSTLDVYPNPSQDVTNIKFTLKENNPVVINVYNVMGELVYTQNCGNMVAGMNKVNFSNDNLASGIYHVVINAGNYNTSTKLMIQK